MALWGKLDQSNNAPKFPAEGSSSANGQVMYANSKNDAFITGKTMGVFMANTLQVNSNTQPGGLKGWNLRTVGEGPVLSIAITNTGRGYGASANGYITFTGYGSGANAQWFSNAAGNVYLVNILSQGSGFNAAPTATIANTYFQSASNANVNLTVTVGGHAGRIRVETLVALKNVT